MSVEIARASHLEVGFKGRTVWSDANFRVNRGEFVAVIGPNGAGKTTLFRLLLGTVRSTGGSLQVFGSPPRRGNAKIGYVPQNHAVDRETNIEAGLLVRLAYACSRTRPGRARSAGVDGTPAVAPSGWQNFRARVSRAADVLYPYAPNVTPGMVQAERDAVDAALRSVGATELARKSLGAMSGGELQRIFLAEALASRPEILLLDEPLANLDLRRARELVELVHNLVQTQEVATLLVAHDINPLIRCLDKVIYIANGRVATGLPDEVLTTESLSRLYGVPVEVLRDSRGNLVIVGGEDAHGDPAE